MSVCKPYVLTAAICDAVKGREIDILSALGIQWNGKSHHIRCPYPNHADNHPSWRWDQAKTLAHCTCTPSASILDVVCQMKGIGFDAAKIATAQIIGQTDLIIELKGRKYQRAHAAALLSPASNNRDDTLAWNYLGHRLAVDPARVPRPSTKVVGIKSLPYFDPPKQQHGKPVLVGHFPAAIFETKDCEGKRHAHRIYLSLGGEGKAELGTMPEGEQRNAKKSATKTKGDNTAGRAVIWGDPSTAETEMIFEGIETAAAAALAFETEIANGNTVVAACITAGGIEAFKPWRSAKRVIVGADRDEACNDGRASTRRGEVAAQKCATLHHRKIKVFIALRGELDEKVDWLDVLRRDGVEAVRHGILAAHRYVPSEPADQKPDTDNAEIARLARLSHLSYDREREAAADRLGCRIGTLDEQVKAARAQTVSSVGQGRPIDLPETEPWHEPVEGEALLDALSRTIREYVILSEAQADAIALWNVHTHAHDACDVSPKLILKSAQKRCGKTRLVGVLARTAAKPFSVSGIKPAALLRIIEMQAPTLLLDEMDAAMNQSHEMAEALRGIINSGFDRAGARFVMNVPTGDGGYEPRQFSTWAPQLLAGIGDLPDTVRDRSIEIDMLRKRTDETVKRLRRRDGADLKDLGRRSRRWADDNLENLRNAVPNMPPGMSDRAADAWEPLFAIADLAGGDWPRRSRKAALALSGDDVLEDENIGTILLSDIRAEVTMDQIKSEELVRILVAIEGHPWAEFGRDRKPITQNRLARLLKPYKITPGTIRIGPGPKDTVKGYKLAHFADVFARYLPAPTT